MPVPSSSEIRITPVPLATPLASPNTPTPTARPGVAEHDLAALEDRRSGTESDHHDAEDGADGARVEHAVDPGAEDQEGQRASEHQRRVVRRSRLSR